MTVTIWGKTLSIPNKETNFRVLITVWISLLVGLIAKIDVLGWDTFWIIFGITLILLIAAYFDIQLPSKTNAAIKALEMMKRALGRMEIPEKDMKRIEFILEILCDYWSELNTNTSIKAINEEK